MILTIDNLEFNTAKESIVKFPAYWTGAEIYDPTHTEETIYFDKERKIFFLHFKGGKDSKYGNGKTCIEGFRILTNIEVFAFLRIKSDEAKLQDIIKRNFLPDIIGEVIPENAPHLPIIVRWDKQAGLVYLHKDTISCDAVVENHYTERNIMVLVAMYITGQSYMYPGKYEYITFN